MREDIWSVTSYFNPAGYRNKKENFDRFVQGLGSAADRLLVVEMAPTQGAFELHDLPRVVRIRGDAVMWQKERMLNIGIEHLPASCTKVAWLDADLLFDDPQWLERTSEALDEYAVVQPFEECIRLGRGQREHVPGQEDKPLTESFAAAFVRDPNLAARENYLHHGHTGFAWAARRSVLESGGLYDACLTGSADHLMAHAFAGTLNSDCISRLIGRDSPFADHFARWAAEVDEVVQGNLGCVGGRVLHLWHGDSTDRRYFQRNLEFQAFDFDPERHIRLSESGLWEWAEAPPAMRDWCAEWFGSRKEEGRLLPNTSRAKRTLKRVVRTLQSVTSKL